MKVSFMAFSLLFISIISGHAQSRIDTVVSGNDTIYTEHLPFKKNAGNIVRVDSLPKFYMNVDEYVRKELASRGFKKTTHKQSIRVTFLVNEDGKLGNIRVIDRVRIALSKMLVSIVGEMPAWRPAYVDGKAIKLDFFIKLKL